MFPLYLDEDSLRHALVRSLRVQGIDLVTTEEAARLHTSDEAQLAFAVAQGRVIYTSNVRDFMRLHRDWLQSGRHHAGIVVLADQQASIGAQTRAFVRLMAERSPETMQDRLEFLDNWIT